MDNVRLNEKQKAFAEYYIETLNAYESAVRAGYSENYARAQSYKMLENVGIKSYIEKRLKELEDKRIAKADEVLQLLTSMARNEITEEIPILSGEGVQEIVDKGLSARDRLKALELLGKRYALFTDKVDLDGDIGLNLVIDYGEDEES